MGEVKGVTGGKEGRGVSDLIMSPFFSVFQLPQTAKSLNFTRVKQVTRNYGSGVVFTGEGGYLGVTTKPVFLHTQSITILK